MKIQDYIMQNVPLKMQAEMGFKQGDYQIAADKIYEFALKCTEADNIFPRDDPKTDQVIFIGYNNATLMFNQILELTAIPISHPVTDNPYMAHTSLAQQ